MFFGFFGGPICFECCCSLVIEYVTDLGLRRQNRISSNYGP